MHSAKQAYKGNMFFKIGKFTYNVISLSYNHQFKADKLQILLFFMLFLHFVLPVGHFCYGYI